MAVERESPLKQEFEYYLANQDALVSKYRGKFIVIKDRKVIGNFTDQLTAVLETQKTHPLGTFLVQMVEPGTGSHSQTFHSRVTFAR